MYSFVKMKDCAMRNANVALALASSYPLKALGYPHTRINPPSVPTMSRTSARRRSVNGFEVRDET
jgi:hypothetical protein